MPLQAIDCQQPLGELNGRALWPQWFVGDIDGQAAVDATIDAYLTQGYANAAAITVLVNKDSAARSWAYHRAYQQAYDRLVLMPSTVNTSDEGGSSYTEAQLTAVADAAASHLAAHTALVEAVTLASFLPAFPRASASVEVGMRW